VTGAVADSLPSGPAQLLALPAKLVLAAASESLASLSQLVDTLPSGAPAVLDAGALVQFDTSALAVLLALRRHCAGQGRRLQTVNFPPRLAGLAKLYGVEALV
jgi:phospholipid transport system transporter-binding protein